MSSNYLSYSSDPYYSDDKWSGYQTIGEQSSIFPTRGTQTQQPHSQTQQPHSQTQQPHSQTQQPHSQTQQPHSQEDLGNRRIGRSLAPTVRPDIHINNDMLSNDSIPYTICSICNGPMIQLCNCIYKEASCAKGHSWYQEKGRRVIGSRKKLLPHEFSHEVLEK